MPMLKWLLTQQQDLSKRAFVGYHLMDVPLPQEMLMAPDDETLALINEAQALREEFKALHKQVEAIRGEGRDLPKLKAEVDRLTEDREILQEHVGQRRERAGHVPKDLLEASTKLQAQRDTAADLQQQLEAQRKMLDVRILPPLALPRSCHPS